jgi:hypothetical protein
MVDTSELKALQGKFQQGLDRLRELSRCLKEVCARSGLNITVEALDEVAGELPFWFAGTRYAVKVRLTDRSLDDVGVSYSVPLGWLDWGRYGTSQRADQSDFYDDKGIMCEAEKVPYHCDLSDCENGQLEQGLLHTLQRLVAKTVALNNTGSP